MADLNEVLLINKPKGWTSFDVVAKVRSTLNNKQQRTSNKQTSNNQAPKRIKVGHAGTLDPFATGLLIVLVGKETKEQDKFMKLDKEYIASVRLGKTSSTGDPEGVIEEFPNSKFQIPDKLQINKALKKFTGKTTQTPPAFSAIKIKGERAYKLARAGKKVELKPRTIILYSIDILDYGWPKLEIKVKCSSGTYIRTLAEDIGKELGCGAYLTDLKRTKIGKYDLGDAKEVQEISLTQT